MQSIIELLTIFLTEAKELSISFFSKIAGERSQSFWLMVQSLAIILSLFIIYRQIKLLRYSNMLQTLNDMRENWNSEQMVKFRKITCENHLKGNKKIGKAEGEILGFFEQLGLLLKKGVINEEFIWESYSYLIENYWSMLESNINELRQSTQDKSWYDHFEFLRESVKKYAKGRKLVSKDKTEEDINRFISSEIVD